jgi:hypothetical protein
MAMTMLNCAQKLGEEYYNLDHSDTSYKVNGSDLVSCPMIGFDVSSIKILGSRAYRVLLN